MRDSTKEAANEIIQALPIYIPMNKEQVGPFGKAPAEQQPKKQLRYEAKRAKFPSDIASTLGITKKWTIPRFAAEKAVKLVRSNLLRSERAAGVEPAQRVDLHGFTHDVGISLREKEWLTRASTKRRVWKTIAFPLALTPDRDVVFAKVRASPKRGALDFLYTELTQKPRRPDYRTFNDLWPPAESPEDGIRIFDLNIGSGTTMLDFSLLAGVRTGNHSETRAPEQRSQATFNDLWPAARHSIETLPVFDLYTGSTTTFLDFRRLESSKDAE